MPPPLVVRLQRISPALVVGALAVVGALFIAFATRWGPWAGSDSVEYVEAARNLAAGKGLVLVRASGAIVPMYLRPPLYSIALAGLFAIGMDAIGAGRLIAIAVFCALLLPLALLTPIVKDRYAIPAFVAAYLISCPALVMNSTGLMSESPFILLVFLALSLALGSLPRGRERLQLAAALLAGLSCLTRFAGVACVAAVSLAPFLQGRHSIATRVVRSVVLSIMGLLPVALWSLYVRMGGYTPGVYAWPQGNLWTALAPVRSALTDLMWEWLPLRFVLPLTAYRLKAMILLGIFGFLAWAAVRLALADVRPSARPEPRTFVSFAGLLLLLFALIHTLVVAATFLFVALPRPSLNERVLLPSQVTFIAGLILVLYRLLMDRASSAVRLALPLAFVGSLVASGWSPTWHYVESLHQDGLGYTSRTWQQSPILEAMSAVAEPMAIVSNDIDAVTFYAGRPAFLIPELEAPRPPSAWTAFGQDPQSHAERLFAEGDAALVLFNAGRYQFDQLYGEDAPARIGALLEGLHVQYEGPDGGIYLSGTP